MNSIENSAGIQESEESQHKIRDYATALNINFTGRDSRARLLRDLKKMQEGGGDRDAREGQFGKFTDDELGMLYAELIVKHKWPES